MEQQTEEKGIRRIFQISIALKGFNAFLEIAGGALLLFSGSIAKLIAYLAEKELVEDPRDFVANAIQRSLPYLSEHSQVFAAFYLFSHGIIKIFLVVGLLRNRLWAYPSALVVFFLFIVYQMYRYTYTHSFFLILLTIFDLFVVWLTWHEYKIIRKTIGK